MAETLQQVTTEAPNLVENLAMAAATANATTKFTPTPEGMACAYLSLMLMALVPIFYGSFKSIKHQKETYRNFKETGEQTETMTDKDAAMFPLIASCALFGFYILIKLCPSVVNLIVSCYFFLLGVFATYRIIRRTTFKIFPSRFNKIQYTFLFGSKVLEQPEIDVGDESSITEDREELVPTDVMYFSKFRPSDILAFILAIAFGCWYLWTKHWLANNFFGLTFALSGIELLPITTVRIGSILLCGLFFYDVFWVFCTDVMVSVAKKFDGPIKILFPQDFLVSGLWGKNFAMLGLGDIVIPGIYIAFLLRFDHSLKRGKNVYFWSCFLAYIFGLAITIGVMSYFKHAQPALLYLVPCCILTPFAVAFVNGDLGKLLAYRDHPLPVDEGEEEHNEDDEDQADEDESEEVDGKKTRIRKTNTSISTRASSKKNK